MQVSFVMRVCMLGVGVLIERAPIKNRSDERPSMCTTRGLSPEVDCGRIGPEAQTATSPGPARLSVARLFSRHLTRVDVQGRRAVRHRLPGRGGRINAEVVFALP